MHVSGFLVFQDLWLEELEYELDLALSTASTLRIAGSWPDLHPPATYRFPKHVVQFDVPVSETWLLYLER